MHRTKKNNVMKRITYLVSVLLMISSFSSYAQEQPLELSFKSTYATGVFDESATEIVAYDSASEILFSTNGDSEEIDVLDVSDPKTLTNTNSIDVSNFGDEPNSVTVKDGFVAAAVEADDVTDKGQVVFMEASNQTVVGNVEVGFLPDMVTFTPDGNKVVVANEGEPDEDYIADPMGSVSVIDVSGGVSNVSQSDVTDLDFNGVNIPQDVRIFPDMQPAPIDQNFQDTGNFTYPSYFDTVSIYSNENWTLEEFNGDFYAEINGFGADTASNDWLISREIDLQTANTASFEFGLTKRFGGPPLKVKVSTNYSGNGNVDQATWDTVPFNRLPDNSNFESRFYQFNFDSLTGESIHVAFQYTSTGTGGGDGAWFQVDSLKFEISTPDANNLEPEYVSVSEDSETAFVSLQENNALASVDLTNNTISDIIPLGYKDHSKPENAFDASDDDGKVDIKTHPTLGMYQPDAIENYTVNGTNYIVSANEGDAREYEGTPGYEEEVDIEDLMEAGRLDINDDDIPDTDTVSRYQELNTDTTLGELDVTKATGDNDNDGLIEQLHSFGARSFGIWTASSGLIWDSKSAFEDTLASRYPNHFNNDNDENEFDGRSDAKGPEPEAIELAEINERVFAFIGLERMGGIMVYEITDPQSPEFVQYFLNRDFNTPVDQAGAGDLGPESIEYISAEASPDDTAYLAVGNEVSGNISFYQISNNMVTSGLEQSRVQDPVSAFPNPVTEGTVHFSETADFKILNNNGQIVKRGQQQDRVNVSDLPNGFFILKLNNQKPQKLIKQ